MLTFPKKRIYLLVRKLLAEQKINTGFFLIFLQLKIFRTFVLSDFLYYDLSRGLIYYAELRTIFAVVYFIL